jgi:phosphinothricin acetyltransferase
MAETAQTGVAVRPARPEDLPRIREIYAHHVVHGLASFEETAPDLAEMTRRFEATQARGMPYLVAHATAKQDVLGYAYAGPYRTRPAYRFTVENSVYVAPGSERHGIGRVLLAELIEGCTALGLRQMVAIIGDSGHLPSIAFHESFGFTRIGTIRAVGFKLGRWVDSVILQRPLGEGAETLPGDKS